MATVEENLLKVNEGIDKVEALNAELAQSLYGGDTGYQRTLEENTYQAKSDIVAIKDKIVECGVEVAEGTHTREYATKVKAVYEKGKQDGSTSFDYFMSKYASPKKKDLDYLFAGQAWNNTTFYPPAVTLTADRAMYMFSRIGFNGDLAQRMEDCGFFVDFSKCKYIDSLFQNAMSVTRLGVLDFSGASLGSKSVFLTTQKLVTIDKIIVGENTKEYTNWFTNNTTLENLTIEGVIDKNGFDTKSCTKLSKASIISIINCLSTNTSGLSITLSKTAVETAFGSTTSTEWTTLIGTRPNWTISLV